MSSATILGCAGPSLGPAEAAFFREADPWGFILFARNVEAPEQLATLIAQLRESVGRQAPILIDQEGGRVARLRPPHWRDWAPIAALAASKTLSPEERVEAMRLRYALIGLELSALGIDVNCMPLLDLPQPGAHDIIGDRASGTSLPDVILNGRAIYDGLMDVGVLPVIKHIPGHGRATADTHEALDVIDTPLAELRTSDFAAFKPFADAPLAMTAHLIYSALDPENCATLSPSVMRYIREELSSEALIMTDDLSMHALSGDFAERTRAALAAGCDIVLHCNGKMPEMERVAGAASALSGQAQKRADHALSMRGAGHAVDANEIAERYAALASRGGVVDA